MYVASICLCVKFMEIKEHEPPSITDTNHYLGKPRINVLKVKKWNLPYQVLAPILPHLLLPLPKQP